MSRKNHVYNKKISGNHTTLIDASISLIKEVVKWEQVRRVTPGFIKSGLKNRRSHRFSIKIETRESSIFMKVRGNISTQEINIYTSDVQVTAKKLARLATDENYEVLYSKA